MEHTNLCVVHLTDLHFNKDHFVDDAKVNSIIGLINNCDCTNVLFVLSGDLSNEGSKDSFASCDFFLHSILSGLKQTVHVYISAAPGNHDCHYEAKPSYLIEEALSVNQLNFQDKLNERLPMFENFDSFSGSLAAPVSKPLNELLEEQVLNIDGKTISVFTLNDAPFCCCTDQELDKRYNDADCGNVFIPESYFTPIENCSSDYAFVVMHIPFGYFDEDTQNSFAKATRKKVNYVFAGHTHNPKILSDKMENDSTITIIGPAFDSEDSVKDDFSILDFRRGKHTFFKFENGVYSATSEEDCSLFKKDINRLGLVLNKDFETSITTFIFPQEDLNLNDVFVFPDLRRKPFGGEAYSKSVGIGSLDQFDDARKRNDILAIYGDNSYGKSALCHYLFLTYFLKGIFPVCIDCTGIRTSNRFEEALKSSMLNEYTNKSIYDIFRQTDSTLKIALLDNAKYIDDQILIQALRNFSSVVVFEESSDTSVLLEAKDKIEGYSIDRYFLEPMYCSKRKELLGKIYDVGVERNHEDVEWTRSQYITLVESGLNRFDKVNDLDPATICFFALEGLRGSSSFNSRLFSSANEARLEISLENALKLKKLSYNDLVIKRIVSNLAYFLYEKQQMLFSSDDMLQFLFNETKEYGDSGIKNQTLISVLLEARIIKENDDAKYSFFSREVFAYFIAYECVRRNTSVSRDGSLIQEMFHKDFSIPLNFLIIMSISTSIKSEVIPVSLADYLVELSANQKTINEHDLLSFAISTEEIQKLKSLSKDDVKAIDERVSKEESVNRELYLQNKDNYFYFEKASEDVKEIEEWMNRIKIVNVLLDKFSSQLPLEKKQALLSCSIKLPNIVISKFHDTLFKQLDELYAQLVSSNPEKMKDELIDEFTSLFVDIKRAFILMTYSNASQGFTDTSVIKLLQQRIKEDEAGVQTQKIQELMLLSYSRKTDLFIEKTKEYLDKNSKESYFVKTSAFIIARNYCIRNREEVAKKHRDLWELVVQKEPLTLVDASGKKN